jgi:HTH-type transcriptional regulator/antitoxin HigA
MITNERQYGISKAQLSKLKEAAKAFDIDEAAKRTGSRVLAKAELEALRSEQEVLSAQLREYETLKSGAVTVLKAENLDVPSILIRARIAKGLSQRQLADKLGLKEQQIQRYESQEYASANLPRLAKIADVLGLNIKEEAKLEPLHPIQISMGKEGIEWDRFPVEEMHRRNWFQEFTDLFDDVIPYRDDELLTAFIKKAMPGRQPALLRHKARHGTKMNPYGLLAWQCRVLILAQQVTLENSYSRDLITVDWLRGLAQESRFDNGPRRAKEKLAQVGIPLIVEPHLPQTYLDGAAFLLPDKSPVIGMSLRYDRVDNFWFVLFHELIHVIKHLRQGKLGDIFDDLPADRPELDAEPDGLEQEANTRAGSALIPDSDWEVALARYVRTEESIKSLAEDLHIHPAIVAGRIQKEANNYVILNEMVGQGEVRKCFPKVNFG